MDTEEYWKDKRIGHRQVLFAWVIVILLALGAQFAEMAFRGLSLGVETDRFAATAMDGSKIAPPRPQSLR